MNLAATPPPPNWQLALNRMEHGEADEAEKAAYEGAVNKWRTCAIGTLPENVPRYKVNGRPKDVRLQRMGREFSDAVQIGDYPRARQVLKRIEARGRELL